MRKKLYITEMTTHYSQNKTFFKVLINDNKNLRDLSEFVTKSKTGSPGITCSKIITPGIKRNVRNQISLHPVTAESDWWTFGAKGKKIYLCQKG